MRSNLAAILVGLALTTCPSQAADLVGSWEGQYFCNAPNPVGQLKLRIVNEGGRLVAHESYSRGSNSGTVVYRVEQQAPDRFRLVLDRDRTRDFGYTYHLNYRLSPEGKLAGEYIGHRNCQSTSLAAVAPQRPKEAPRQPVAKNSAPVKAGPVPEVPEARKGTGSSPDWAMLDPNEKQAWGEMLKDCGATAAQSALPQCLIKMVGLQTRYQARMSIEFLKTVAQSLTYNQPASCWVMKEHANDDIKTLNRRTGARFRDLTTCNEAAELLEGTYGIKPRWQDCRSAASYENYAICMKTYFGTPDEEAALRKLPTWAGVTQTDNVADKSIGSYFSGRNNGVAAVIEPILEVRRKLIADFKASAIDNARLCERDGKLGGSGFQQLADVVVQAAQPIYTELRGNYASCEFIRKFAEETGLVGPAGQQTPEVAVALPEARLLELADAAAARFADYRFVALEDFNLYATEPNACSSLFVDVRKRHPDVAAVKEAVTSTYAKSVRHLAYLAYECERSEAGTSFEVSYFGQPLFTVREGKIAATHATAHWNANELPDEANYNVLMDGLDFRGATTQEKRANLVRAIMLGSRAAGYILAVTYGREEYVTTFGFAVAEKAPREKALKYLAAYAMSLARSYRIAEERVHYLPAVDLAMVGDWAVANPRANPLAVTEADVRAAMTKETAQSIQLPTGQEIAETLGGYFSDHCSYFGMLAHGQSQRGAPPAPAPDVTWTPGKGTCSASRFGVLAVTLAPASVRRHSCTAGAAKDSYECKIEFWWRCDGDGFGNELTCKIIRALPSPGQISLVDDPDKPGRGWKAVKFVYDGEFKEPPPPATKDWSPCDAYRGIPLTSRMRTALALGGCW